MHFSTLLLAASAAVVHSASTVTNTATVTSTLSPQETCLASCNKGDVTCQAQCVGVPHPGASQMNLTTNCVANCDQGDGSPAASAAYAACMNACISSYIILTGTAAPGGDYSTAGVTPSGVSASTTATGAANATGANASSTSKALAAPTDAARLGVVGGSLGLVFAAFALL